MGNFREKEKLWILIVVVSQVCTSGKIHPIVHFKCTDGADHTEIITINNIEKIDSCMYNRGGYTFTPKISGKEYTV